MVGFSFSLTVRTLHGLVIQTYNLARTLGIRTRTPKYNKGKKKGRSVEVRPFPFGYSSFLSSGSAKPYGLRVYVRESCQNRAGLARNGERDVREGDRPDKDLRLLTARALEGEVFNSEPFRADVDVTPSCPRLECLRGNHSR